VQQKYIMLWACEQEFESIAMILTLESRIICAWVRDVINRVGKYHDIFENIKISKIKKIS